MKNTRTSLKILIAADTYYPSVNGAAYFAYRLATRLAKEGHEVYVIAPSTSFKHTRSIHEGIRVSGVRSVPVLFYPKFRFAPLLLSRRHIKNLVKEINPDIIHIQNHFNITKGVVTAARKLGIPVVGTNHFMPENLIHYFHLPAVIENKVKKAAWSQFTKVFSQVEFVTSPTATAIRLIENKGIPKQNAAISCGIDLERFNPSHDSNYLRKRYNIPSHQILLYVGRLDREKRIDDVIRSLPGILRKVDMHYVVAGTGKLRSELEALAKKLRVANHVTFTGFVPDEDLAALYCMADIFVTSGTAELQSIVTMEAMASGLPIIAVDAMALPELVHDNENGFLFPVGNISKISESALQILSSPSLKKKMSKKSLEIIQSHDIRKIILQYVTMYLDAIKTHKARHTSASTSVIHSS